MVEAEMTRDRHDDPRKLTAMIARVSDLAANHAVCSVVVGVAAEEGDLFFPDYIDYLVSALRVEDARLLMALRPVAQQLHRRRSSPRPRRRADMCTGGPAEARGRGGSLPAGLILLMNNYTMIPASIE